MFVLNMDMQKYHLPLFTAPTLHPEIDTPLYHTHNYVFKDLCFDLESAALLGCPQSQCSRQYATILSNDNGSIELEKVALQQWDSQWSAKPKIQ